MIIQVIRVNLGDKKSKKINDIQWFNNQDNGLQNLRGRSDSYGHRFPISFLNFHFTYDKIYELYRTILFSCLGYYQSHLMYT